MERFDAIVVGGGPAGATAACDLVKAGLSVIVVDKQTFPRDKVCAGWVTPPVWQALQLDPADYAAAGHTLQPIRRFRTALLGREPLDTDYDAVVSYAIRRIEFDHYLLQHSGAQLCLGQGVEKIERNEHGWRINGLYAAPLLIGAGGHSCPVARQFGAQLGSGPGVVAAQEIEFEMCSEEAAHCAVAADRPELYFVPELDGYGWVVRKGNYLNVGLGRDHGQGIAQQVSAFRDLLVSNGTLPASTPTRFKGHAYCLYPQHQPRPLYGDGMLLVGDAAGLAYEQSGEGIYPAVVSAQMAAATAIEAQGDYRAARLKGYEARMRARFGTRRAHAPLPSFISPLKRWVVPLLFGNRTFTRHLLLDRWFLHR